MTKDQKIASNAVPAGDASVALESAESRENDKNSLGETEVKFRFKFNYLGIAAIAATIVGVYVGFKVTDKAVSK